MSNFILYQIMEPLNLNKKVFVLSDENDGTTDDVLDWLSYWNIPFCRFSGTSAFHIHEISIFNGEIKGVLEVDKQFYRLEEFSSYWYRRGRINLYNLIPSIETNQILDFEIYGSLSREKRTLSEMLYYFLEQLPGIGSYHHNNTNKLVNLCLASSCGLLTPDSIILDNKKELLKYLSSHQKVITKPAEQGGLVYTDQFHRSTGGTELVDDDFLAELPDTFFPSLFQSYVEKEFELRVFYLNGKTYTSAILSQLDEQTKVDFRNYNFNKPNRTPPYQISLDLEKKIKLFMEKLNMNSGSLDFVVGEDEEIYFLEVNPIGQFFQVSYPCNYFLEREVALSLSKLNCNSI